MCTSVTKSAGICTLQLQYYNITSRRREAGPATYPCRDDDERFSSEKKNDERLRKHGRTMTPSADRTEVEGPGRPSLMDKDNQMRCCFRATTYQLAEQTATIMVVVAIIMLRLIVESLKYEGVSQFMNREAGDRDSNNK
jgi:hypothetical protein